MNDNMTKLAPELIIHEDILPSQSTLKFSPAGSKRNSSIRNSTIMNASIMGMDMSLKQSNGNKRNKATMPNSWCDPKYVHERSSGYLSRLMEASQIYTLTMRNVETLINQNRQQYNDDITASAASHCHTLLSMSRNCKDGQFRGTIRECLIEIKNISTRKAMESGKDSLPGFEQSFHFTDLTDDIIMLFILKHNDTVIDATDTGTSSGLGENNDEGHEENINMHENRTLDNENTFDNELFTLGDSDSDQDSESENQEHHNPGHQTNHRRTVDTATREHQKNVNKARASSCFDTTELAMIELLDMLAEAGAPIYLFDKLTSWCKRSSNAFQNERLVSRELFLKRLSLKVYGREMTRELRPKVVRHKLPSGKKIDVTAFSFKAKLASILMDDDLMQQQNLLLNKDNPFSPPDTNEGVLSDLNTGWWWRQTWLETCRSDDEILCPILFFLDAGRATKRVSVEPLTFTIGLLKRDIRNLSKAWRTLGYLENISNSDSEEGTEVEDVKTVAAKMNEYHSILNLLLNEIRLLQGHNGGLQWDLKFGDKTHRVVFKFAIQVILGDCKGNNVLCGQYGGHSLLSNRLCRDCFVSPSDSDNPYHQCKFIGIDDVSGKTKKELNAMSMHKIENAFHGLYFGARTSSIYNCTPPEPLHGLLLGTVKYLFEEFERTIPNSTMSLINKFAKAKSRLGGHEVTSGMPSFVSFKHGVTNCDTLTANQQYARLFLIFISLHLPNIFRSLCLHKRSRRVAKEDSQKFRMEDVDPLGHAEGVKWFSLLEETLCFYQWLMKDRHSQSTFEHSHNLRRAPTTESKAMKSIRKYMASFKHLVGNRPGHGLKITKFHQLLHYPRQILKDGSIKNVDTGVCEGMAVKMYKRLVTRTQRRESTLNRELANRHLETLLLSEAVRLTSVASIFTQGLGDLNNGDTSIRSANDGSFKGTRYFIEFPEEPHGNIEIRWRSKTKDIGFDATLSFMLAQRLFLNTGDGGCVMHHNTVPGYTEYLDSDANCYRAHPNFRGNGAWNDWCMVSWEGIDDLVPAQLITFLDLTECEFMTDQDQQFLSDWIENEWEGNVIDPISDTDRAEYLCNGKWAVVRSGMIGEELELYEETNGLNSDQTMLQFVQNSRICQRFRLEQHFKILPIEALKGKAYCSCLGTNTNNDEYIVVQDCTKWSNNFLNDDILP